MKPAGWVLIVLGVLALIAAVVLGVTNVDADVEGETVSCGSVLSKSDEFADAAETDIVWNRCDGAVGNRRRLVVGAAAVGVILVVVGVIVGRRPAVSTGGGGPDPAAA